MNSSAENKAAIPVKQGLRFLLDPRTWNIQLKVRLNFFLRAVVAIGLMVSMINLFQSRITVREVNDKLRLLSDVQSKYIENYFVHISQQLKSFSTDRHMVEAFNQLSGSFLNIENDNYFTPAVSEAEKLNTIVEGYYTAEILPALEDVTGDKINLSALLPADSIQRILQFLYLAGNPKPWGAKGLLSKADDGSTYSYTHSQYHPEILGFARQWGITDILFVDYKTGYLTYSMQKNLDFATNFFNGPHKNSGLGLAFKNAISQKEQGSVAFVDASLYIPALYQPHLFISAPVFNGPQLLGAVIFAVNTSVLDNLLSVEKADDFTGSSLKALLIGTDMLYRCNDPGFTSDRPKYLHKLKRNAYNGETLTHAQRTGTTALIQSVDPLAFNNAVNGKADLAQYTTETGERVLCYYQSLKIQNLPWILVTQIDRSEALVSAHRFVLIVFGIALLIAGLFYYMAGITSNAIANRLIGLRNYLVSLSRGEKVQVMDTGSGDELAEAVSAVGKLSARIQESSTFLSEMGKGNIDLDFRVIDENDHYGISMNSLKQSLVLKREGEEKRKKEDEIRSWTTHGIAMFNDILRTDNHDLEKLSLNITRSIIQYLSANQGGLFLIEEDEGTKYLNLVAAYAYDRQKFLKKRINVGEGLAGNCVLEKKTVLLNRIPENYIEISSGLGGAKPKCLMIVPLMKDEEVLGVLEMASFNDFRPHEVEFVEKVAESITATLITVQLHQQTSQFLEKFQQQAEEMKAQDEELRQNIEELQATHEQMERLKQEEAEHNHQMMKELEDYRKLLISVLNEVPEKIFLKDDKGRFIIANKLVADNYNKTVEEILGKSDFDFYPSEEATEFFNREQEIIQSGKTLAYEEGDPSKGDGLIVRSIKKPFYIEHMGITGLFGVQFDITDIKQKEIEAIKMADEIKIKQKELEDEKALLEALLNNVPECIYFKDKESRFIRFSKSMLKLFGLEKDEELIGKSDYDFFSDEHARPAYEDEQNIIKTGKAIIDLEEKEVMDDGRVSWVNTTKMPLTNTQGEIIGTFGISKSISRIKNMEMEAREMTKTIESHRKLLIDILDKVPAKIFLKDENGVFVVVNTAVASVYNKTPEQIIGTSDYDNHPDDDVDSWRAQELEIVNSGEKTYLHLEKMKGGSRYLNTTKMPFMLATTGKTGLLGIQFDVTDTKVMEEQVHALKAEVEKMKK